MTLSVAIDVSRTPDAPVPTYLSHVAGRDVDSARHLHTVAARSVLTDVFASMTRKRRLDQGENAATDGVVGRCAIADAETVAAATRAAAAAAPEWAATPLATRIRLGHLVRERVRERAPELVDLLVAEGIPVALARWQVGGVLDLFSRETLDHLAGQLHRTVRHGDRELTIRRVADGVVCVDPPRNAPAASALLGVTPLLAGNAVVVRAPRSAPLGVLFALRELVLPALAELGAPPGTLNFFCARPGPVLRAWLDSPDVHDVFYTGDVERGLELERECVAMGKKPILELAGNDCVVVWRDADLGLAVEALTEAFYGSGQLCLAPNQVVAHPDIADDLLARLTVAAREVRPGYPDEEGVLLSPVLRAERFFALVRDALDRGAALVCGGRRLEVDGEPSDTGPFLEPTVVRVDGLAGARRIAAVAEETFFPLLPVIVPEPGPDLLDRVLTHVNTNRYGLRNSLWAGDDAVVERFLARTGNGGLLKVNDSHLGWLPFLPTHGGTGLTGGVFGEANYPALRTSHLQGISRATGIRPRAAVFDSYRLGR
ncbi:aldehyde dehydrogenase family protein [Actinophytocola gossypii]|uniref:Aldehyde dehydrogenase n=1 Tax=Actinophytocola gossypii TaxID=2812003 RepID=A0ABT2J4U1_9PSEU|nr:aldehyde dehydrogenase [Actinophytocola gossypii]MCT2582798.1 aldehyde dehydrogenase [Actinophytocola gossypii]